MKSNNELNRYVNDLVHLGRRNSHDLTVEEERHLTGLIMGKTSLYDLSEYVIETDKFDDVLTDLTHYLSSFDNKSSKEQDARGITLLETLARGAVRYAQNEIDRLLDDKALEIAFELNTPDYDNYERDVA